MSRAEFSSRLTIPKRSHRPSRLCWSITPSEHALRRPDNDACESCSISGFATNGLLKPCAASPQGGIAQLNSPEFSRHVQTQASETLHFFRVFLDDHAAFVSLPDR